MTESEEKENNILKVKQEHEKAGLKLNIQKVKTIIFDPNTSWQIDGQKLEAVTDFYFFFFFWELKNPYQ